MENNLKPMRHPPEVVAVGDGGGSDGSVGWDYLSFGQEATRPIWFGRMSLAAGGNSAGECVLSVAVP